MDIMRTSFTPSVNIVRDFNKQLTYIPTGNSHQIYNRIASEFKTGTRSFNIIGSYGTGKSAFLWAIEKQLSNRANYFGPINGQFTGIKKFEPLNIVGDYESIIHSFARYVGLTGRHITGQLILNKLATEHDRRIRNKTGLLIVIDELGKFLEYAATNNPENEIYFIQRLAEFCNDPSRRLLLLTSLHQGFDSYAKGLDQAQKQEWEKVKGRLRELPFNEPVPQLLFLAAEYLYSQNFNKISHSAIEAIVSFTEKARAYAFDTHSIQSIAKKLLPLDPLSAAVLALALQDCGQNERSLFTFLSSQDHLGIGAFDHNSNPLYNMSCVYDYLIGNYYSFISSRDNHRYVQWAAIQRAIERVEGGSQRDPQDALKLVKSIGLLNIFGADSTLIDSDFLSQYGRVGLGIQEPLRIVKELEDRKILRYIQFKNRYILFEGTDFDFGAAFTLAATKIELVTDIVPKLQTYFSFPVVQCKAATLKKGTPRFFEFQISSELLTNHPSSQIDGVINLVFSVRHSVEEVRTISKNVKEAIIYCVFKKISSIQNILWEIEKTKSILTSLTEDLVARREVKAIYEHQIRELDRLVMDNIFGDSVTWVFSGKEVKIHSQLDLNRSLSSIVDRVYNQTPILHNELINRHRLPPAVVTARNNLFDALIANWDKEDIGFSIGKFPAEKTIYLTLLKNTGIHKRRHDGWSLGKPTDESFHFLWTHCEEFLSGARSTRKSITDIFELLLSKPFRLKRGFLEVWVPIYLFIKREDYALFGEQGYIPHLTKDVFDLILKNPEKYWVKTFDIGGVRLDLLNRYRTFLGKQPSESISSTSFIDTVRPFLTFYRGLPEYSKSTRRLTPSALSLRDAIASAKDPEKTFFDDLPNALGYDSDSLRKNDKQLNDYVEKLQENIREIRTSFDGLVDRIERNLIDHLGYGDVVFPAYLKKFQSRFLTLRKYLMLPHQKTLLQRLTSEMDDRKAWISSIAQCALGKPLELLTDDQEDAVHFKLLQGIKELDDLCEIVGLETQSEEIIRFETTSLSEGTKKKLLRVPKSKALIIDRLSAKLKHQLSSDNDVNNSALLKLLRELNKNE